MNPLIQTIRRAELEARIEEMISLLDVIDGDADFEPYLAGGAGDDRESESELLEDNGDTEPNGDELDHDRCDDEYIGDHFDQLMARRRL